MKRTAQRALALALLTLAAGCHRDTREAQLKALEEAYKSGVFTKEEYDSKRQAILGTAAAAPAAPAPAAAAPQPMADAPPPQPLPGSGTAGSNGSASSAGGNSESSRPIGTGTGKYGHGAIRNASGTIEDSACARVYAAAHASKLRRPRPPRQSRRRRPSLPSPNRL
jgi:hypothetical protein